MKPGEPILPLVCQSPAELRVGASWVVIAEWAAAARRHFGRSVILTPAGALSIEAARELATLTSKGRSQRPLWRRALPEVAVSVLKDARAWRRARRSELPAEASELAGESVPFVWQHHALFQRLGRVLARRLRIPLVVAVEALQVREAAGWGVSRPVWGHLLEARGEKRILERADLVTCVSEELARQVLDLGIDERRVLVTPNRVDPSRFDAPPRDETRRRLALSDRFVVGWAGSFRAFHGLEVLRHAYDELAATIPDLTLMLVGDGPELPAWRELADRIGRPRVVLTGAVPYADIPKLVSAFDVGVIPAPAGGAFHYSPLKLQEFMAAGLAVAAPDIGQIGATLEHERDALLYPAGSSRQLAAAIRRLRADEELRRHLAKSARSLVERSEGTPGDLRRIEARLHELAKRAGRSGSTRL